MSAARQHRERFAALVAAGALANPVKASEEGVQLAETTVPVRSGPVSPALRHAMRHAAIGAALTATAAALQEQVPDASSQEAPFAPTPANADEAKILLQLTHDLRRLHDIKSIEKKIAAKVEMLPAYAPWIEGALAAAAAGDVVQNDVLPTIMVWRLDTGDYAGALPLIEAVLAHDIALPSRYERDPATLIVEEIANAALKTQATGKRFDLDLLTHIEDLTADADIHDQVRAKLKKAIGEELLAAADAIEPGADGYLTAYQAALAPLQRALELDQRVGVKDRIKRVEKAIGAITKTESDAGAAG